MKTDEQIAKDYLNDNVFNHQTEMMSFGIKKGRELEQWKALRFAEFTSHNCDLWTTNPTTYKLLDKDGCRIGEPISEEQLYTSKEFEDYLNSYEK